MHQRWPASLKREPDRPFGRPPVRTRIVARIRFFRPPPSAPVIRVEDAAIGDTIRSPGSAPYLSARSRLSTGKADSDPALPQAYQTGLGPSDLIFGLRGSRGAWQGGLVYQKTGGRSANPITRLRRGDDAVAWLSRSFEWQDTRITLKGLGIKRLSLTSVRDAGASPERFLDVPDSDRLQLNLDLEVIHPLTKALSINGRADFPLLKRSTNVDGLKRSRSSAWD